MNRCETCGRALVNAESRVLGIGPVCLERMRDRGMAVGGKPRPHLLQLANITRRRKPDPGQLPLEGMEP